MRRPRGVLLPPLREGRVRGRDLHRVLRNAVIDGALAPGERLPSTRQAAADYGVSRGLVETVYGQLLDEGFVERGVGRGTFVSAHTARLGRTTTTAPRRPRALALSRRGRDAAARAACREPEVLRPFNAGVADTREFPWRTWQRLQARATRELGRRTLDFADPRGLPELRAAIARHLSHFRGLHCSAERVVLFASAQQALHALLLLLLDRGDAAWLEDPGYLGARAAFAMAGAAVQPVPVDADGLRVEDGVRLAPRARLAYVTPSHQYPTGATLSLARRAALIEWANRSGAWIVEDDYDSEFRYCGRPLTPVASLDSRERVLYVGTLSKVTFVSLRLAYAVVPEAMVEPLADLRTQLDGFSPALAQATMSLFMDEGHLATHLRRMRAVYAGKRATLVQGLAPLARRGWSWPANAAGLHLLVRHASGAHVRAVAAASGLELAFLRSYRAKAARDDGLLLRFGGLDLESIGRGARALVEAEERTRA